MQSSLARTATGAPTLEISAQRVCRFLYDELHGRRPASLRLVLLQDHAYGSLARIFRASREMRSVRGPASDDEGSYPDGTSTKCTVDSRHLSLDTGRYRFPVPKSSKRLRDLSLIKELGLELSYVLQPSPDM